MLKKSDGRSLLVLFLLPFIGLSCSKTASSPVSENTKKETVSENTKKETVNLPADVRGAVSYENDDFESESSMILTLTSDNRIYQEQFKTVSGKAEKTENIISREELPEKLKKFSETAAAGKKIVYLKTDANAAYDNVLSIFQLIRDAKINRAGLVAMQRDGESGGKVNRWFEVELPENVEKFSEMPKPNPLTLIAMLAADGGLRLNNENEGTISDTNKLENMLSRIFEERAKNGVFRQGSNEIEKKVFVNADKSNKYGDFIKLVDAVKVAGAQPIVIQIDVPKAETIEIKDIDR